MKNQNKIIKLINSNHEDYNNLVFKCFIDWCMLYTVFGIPLKTLINNESLFNWYSRQWQQYVEDEFLNDFKQDITATDNDAQLFTDLLKTYPATIENYYPRAILKMIKATLKPVQVNE